MRRICVVGNGGSGKSTLARALAACLGLRTVDRDALVWGPNWTPLPREQRPAVFEAATRDGGWTYDGHLRAGRPDEELVLARCDGIVWLDLPRRTVMRTVVWRTLRRVLTRERLFNGNVVGWRMALSPEFEVGWAWRNHARLRREYEALFARPDLECRLVRLRSRAEANRWLALACGGAGEPNP